MIVTFSNDLFAKLYMSSTSGCSWVSSFISLHANEVNSEKILIPKKVQFTYYQLSGLNAFGSFHFRMTHL